MAANLNSTASIRPRSVRTGHCQPVAPGAPSAAPTARTTVSAQPIPPGLPPTAQNPPPRVEPSSSSCTVPGNLALPEFGLTDFPHGDMLYLR